MIVTIAHIWKVIKVIKQLGIVREIIVRSRSIFGNTAGGLQTLLGGNITICTEFREKI